MRVSATASWKPDPAQPAVGPMGRAEACDPANPNCPIHTNHGALICRVGASPVPPPDTPNKPFFVGTKFTFVVNDAWSGELQCMINDATDLLGDNSGSANVCAKVIHH